MRNDAMIAIEMYFYLYSICEIDIQMNSRLRLKEISKIFLQFIAAR